MVRINFINGIQAHCFSSHCFYVFGYCISRSVSFFSLFFYSCSLSLYISLYISSSLFFLLFFSICLPLSTYFSLSTTELCLFERAKRRHLGPTTCTSSSPHHQSALMPVPMERDSWSLLDASRTRRDYRCCRCERIRRRKFRERRAGKSRELEGKRRTKNNKDRNEERWRERYSQACEKGDSLLNELIDIFIMRCAWEKKLRASADF